MYTHLLTSVWESPSCPHISTASPILWNMQLQGFLFVCFLSFWQVWHGYDLSWYFLNYYWGWTSQMSIGHLSFLFCNVLFGVFCLLKWIQLCKQIITMYWNNCRINSEFPRRKKLRGKERKLKKEFQGRLWSNSPERIGICQAEWGKAIYVIWTEQPDQGKASSLLWWANRIYGGKDICKARRKVGSD